MSWKTSVDALGKLRLQLCDFFFFANRSQRCRLGKASVALKSDPLPSGVSSGFALGYPPQLRTVRSGGAFNPAEHYTHQNEFLPEQFQDFFHPFVLRSSTDHLPPDCVEATMRGKFWL